MITAQTLDRITHFDGSGLPVVSLYLDIPVDPGQRNALDSRVSSLFEQVALPHVVHEEVVVDVTPCVRPMLAVLVESYRMCVRNHAQT
jgi:hypothetical protein